jgi:predicted dehydrogenase
MSRWRGVAVGCGYFSRFHREAWQRIPQVELTAVCDVDGGRAAAACAESGIPRHYTNAAEMLDAEQPAFVDIITRPETHLELVRMAAGRGVHIICQKPLAPTSAEAEELVSVAESAGVRLIVHENFRFQPWHREIRKLIERGAIGDRLHSLTFFSRPGDGWGPEAYLSRQPYFREMPRLLLFETGIHFIDTFRYLAGEVRRVFCHTRRLNPVIAGEDCGLLLLEFDSAAVGVWDGNRWNESTAVDPRYTFGRFVVEGNGGAIRLDDEGTLWVKPLGQSEVRHAYSPSRQGFGGDCVFATQRHIMDGLHSGAPCETEGRAYLKNLDVLEAAYRSAQSRTMVDV